jgi:hypothetical protein
MPTKTVSDTDLGKVIAEFNPPAEAKIEFNVHADGLSIVANREGWESLAEWCLIMAHPEMQDSIEPAELTDDVLPNEMFMEGRALVSFWAIPGQPDIAYQDVYFHRSDVIGDEYWKGMVKSGNSRYTKPASYAALDRHKWMEGKSRTEVEEKLGEPIYERRSMKGPTVCYKADTPEGWIGVDYNPENRVGSFGFSMTPLWEEELAEGVEVLIEYKGE